MASMTFDLLPLPQSAPRRPFSVTSDFSVFGCDDEFLNISRPIRNALDALQIRLAHVRAATGHYPQTLAPLAIEGVAYSDNTTHAFLRPSTDAPKVRVIYRRFRASYVLQLRFPDLQPNYRPPTAHYDSEPAEAFVSCSAISMGTIRDILSAGGFAATTDGSNIPLFFTPRLGLYTYAS